MSYLYYQNKKIYYEFAGKGNRMVAFLHGNSASSKMFKPVLPYYTKRFKVLLIDFLGHGQSDRLDTFPTDLWKYEADQLIYLVEKLALGPLSLIGTSGGALVGLNAALSRPELFDNLVADSFIGLQGNPEFIGHLKNDRAQAKHSMLAKLNFKYEHGRDWESVVDKDTDAITRNYRGNMSYLHKDIHDLETRTLFTASKTDRYLFSIDVIRTYTEMTVSAQNARVHFFPRGNHPAMISNAQEFSKLAIEFIRQSEYISTHYQELARAL